MGIAWVDYRGAFLPQHSPGMDMAQRPVVEAGVGQVGNRAGGVGIVVEVAAHVGVKQTETEAAARCCVGKERRQVLAHLPPGVADTVDRGSLRLAGKHRLARYFGPEAEASRW